MKKQNENINERKDQIITEQKEIESDFIKESEGNTNFFGATSKEDSF